MDDDWEQLAENENVVIPAKLSNINKWDGEDEEEDVKDNWEDEEEKKDEEKVEVKPIKQTKSKKEKISEKERQKLEEQEEEEDSKRIENMTPEEKLAEKMRLQKIQEEEDLKTALDTFGITEGPSISIDDCQPTNKNEFVELAEAITKKVTQFKNADEFSNLIETLIRNICVNLSLTDLKKVKLTVENMHIEKQRLEKEKTKKPAGKGKTKVKLRVDENNPKTNSVGNFGYAEYDYDDFM